MTLFSQWASKSARRLICRRDLLAREDGQSVMETALAGIGILTLFFGIMETGLALYTYHMVSEAAREGTRYAIVRGSACTSFTSSCPATTANVKSYIENMGLPGITPADMTVTTTWPTTGSTCAPSSSPCNNPGNLVNVKVQYIFPLLIPFVHSVNLTMTSTSQMVISQ